MIEETNNIEKSLRPSEWWRKRRRNYNTAIILSGIGAFICYLVVFETFHNRLGPGADVTLFTTLFQGIVYLIVIGIANICYYIGPISEKIIKPKDIDRYRNTAYNLGLWGSIILPFLIPILVLIRALLSTET